MKLTIFSWTLYLEIVIDKEKSMKCSGLIEMKMTAQKMSPPVHVPDLSTL
jgi:hypothetical protein